MAILQSEIQFTGSLGRLSAYRAQGSDKIILRTKGGPTRRQIKTLPAYANVRKANAEFGGRATTSKWVIRALGPLKDVADSSLSGRINALLKPIQELDTTSTWGKRNVQLSKNPQLLAGFSLQNNLSFDSVIRTPVSFDFSRQEQKARIELPALMPRVNFFPANYPYYRLQVTIGTVPDLFYNETLGNYQPCNSYPMYALAETAWLAVKDKSDAGILDVSIAAPPPDHNFCLLLSIGINYGIIRSGGIERVRKVGCGKVLAVA